MRRVLLLMVAFMAMCSLPALAEQVQVSVTVAHADRIVMTTQGGEGRVVPLTDGTQYVEFDTETDGPTLAITDNAENGYVKSVSANFSQIAPEGDVFYVDLNDLMMLTIVTDPAQSTSKVWFGVNKPEQILVTIDGSEVDLEASIDYTVDKGTPITIQAREGFRITQAETNSLREPMKDDGNGVYSCTASINTLNIYISSKIDTDDNVCITVDDADNIVVTTRDGRVINLQDGDNLMTLDVTEVNPLTLIPANGCDITYVSCNGVDYNGYQTSYQLDLDEKSYNEINITSLSNDNIFFLDIDNKDAAEVSTEGGSPIRLINGNNTVTMWFDMEDHIRITPTGVRNITNVTVDGNPAEAESDGSYYLSVSPRCHVKVITDTPDDEKWITIVDEDFSLFEWGSEDEPDDFPLLNEFGYIMDSYIFHPYNAECTKTWGGLNMYQAGEALAVMQGFVNTPTGNYSGPLKMKFRAKVASGQDYTEHDLKVALIRRSALIDYKTVIYHLTDEWQEFEFEANTGFPRDCMIQFATPAGQERFCFLLDDIEILHRNVTIEAPVALAPINMTDTSFTATWKPTPTAEEYLLSVYTHVPTDQVLDVNEGFENLDEDPAGKLLAPEGWTFSFSDDMGSLSAGINGSKSLVLKSGDRIVVPKSDYEIKHVSFSVRVDDTNNDNLDNNTYILIKALETYDWYVWATIPLTGATVSETHPVDLSQYLGMFDAVYDFSIELVAPQGSTAAISIDNVRYIAPLPPEKDFLWEDVVIKGNEQSMYDVTDENFDPEAEYFYYVKARNAEFTSAPSNEMEVYNASTPVALDATDVTADAYTANWQCGPKVDYFVIDQLLRVTAEEDMADVVILDEDFSNVHSSGTLEHPEEYYTKSEKTLDGLTRLSGWKGMSYGLMEGALGGLGEADGMNRGCITTPEIDLSHNGGTATVSFRAYCSEGEALVIAGKTSSTAIWFDVTGWMEYTTNVYLCGENETISFYNSEYAPFMLDRVTISQSLQKGDQTTIRTKEVHTDNPYDRSLRIEDVDFVEGYELGYRVTGYRMYYNNPKELVLSPASNIVWVPAPDKDSEKVTPVHCATVQAVANGIDITVSREATANIYSTDGRQVACVSLAAGKTHVALDPAIYIVKVDSVTMKVAVK